jgi:hypothetical protein
MDRLLVATMTGHTTATGRRGRGLPATVTPDAGRKE